MNVIDQAFGENWAAYNGDSAEVLPSIPDRSIGLSVFSPPFSSLYTYTPSERDLGNVRSREEFFAHHAFIARELVRVMMPGRVVAVHTQELQLYGTRDGRRGKYDFPGDYLRHMEEIGFDYQGRITINKNPQALKNGTGVLTRTGWVAIENLRVGDEVIGSDGHPTRVVGVYPQGVRPLWRMTFSDGTHIDCDGQHRWAVRNRGARARGRGFVTLTTDQLRETGLHYPSGIRRFEIPIMQPAELGDEAELPIHPYLLGALLGDGSISRRSVAALTTQHEIVARCILPERHYWQKREGTDMGNGTVATYHLQAHGWHYNEVLKTLRDLGLHGKRAWEKSIPHEYQWASVENRRELLRGLLDTDGKIDQHGAIRFFTTSDPLADEVTFLVQSLGGIVRRRLETNRPYRHKGEKRQGRPLHELTIGLRGEWCPFTLPTKVARWRPDRRQYRREIAGLEYVGDYECTCIAVEAADQLYVIEHCLVTHNTAAIRNHPVELLFATLRKDASKLVVAPADYVLIFRSPGDNTVPIPEPVDEETWIKWAHPVWTEENGTGVREVQTLPDAGSKENDDERHLCPLQLPVIERCIRLWSNPGETMLTPFMGIGSEVYQAVLCGRKGIGIELKRSYWKVAVRFCTEAESRVRQRDLFAYADEHANSHEDVTQAAEVAG